MRRFFIAAAAVASFVATAGAQNKVSGTLQCSKPDPLQLLDVGDRPGHRLGVEQAQCTWPKPMEIGGDKTKEGVTTATIDASGGASRVRGVHVATMESGDKYFAGLQGTTTSSKDGAVESKGTWEFTGGTGKLKGIKGKGTYTCKSSSDGNSCEVEGEYELPK